MKKELIVQRSPKSPIAEIFRTLRTNIQFMNSKKKLRTILVTSTMPGEGKSWVSSNLAITFAQAGKKVLLIDADMRKGRLAALFQIDKVPGLSNLLSGIDEKGVTDDEDILKYVRPTEVENLFLIPTGNVPPNPAELLGTEATIQMIEKFKEVFDIIMLDATPGMLVTDAMILSRIADTTLLVASHKSTKKDDLVKVKRLIENVGGNIAGVILNKTPVKAKEYSTSYYYGSKSSDGSSSHHHHHTSSSSESKVDFDDLKKENNSKSSNDNKQENFEKRKSSTDSEKNENSKTKYEDILAQLNNYMKNKDSN